MAKRFGRLTKAAHRAVQRGGSRVAVDAVVVYARRNGGVQPRVGLSVSRQFGGAVQRNRLRRRVREACQRQWTHVPAGMDLVMVPRAPAQTMTMADLEAALAQVLARLKDR